MYDVIIVGGGICGCALLHALAEYHLRVLLLERENDVALGASRANSAILHAGYDPLPGTAMAKWNVPGNVRTKELCRALDVPMKEVGSLVLAFSSAELEMLHALRARGRQNGVPGLALWDAQTTLEREPNLNPAVMGALYAPTAAIVNPWELVLALAETAIRNGAEVRLNSEVTAIAPCARGFCVHTAAGEAHAARFVVDAAGVYADRVHDLVAPHSFGIRPSRGEYYLLDKSQGGLVSRVIFQCPTEAGKGVLVAPTVHGNLIVGPNAEPAGREDTAVTRAGLEDVARLAKKSVPGVDLRQNIRNFAGLRASAGEDFIVGEAQGTPGFFLMAGIKSPGLSSAAAMAQDVAELLFDAGLPRQAKENPVRTRKVMRFAGLDHAARARLAEQNPLYGRVICRCETVTEAEILDALKSPLPPASIDGIKRRAGAGMGRCQGGFCGPRVHELLARELGIPAEQVLQNRQGSQILVGKTKGEA